MSQQDYKTEVIDGVEYRMRPLPPRTALHFIHRVLQIIAPSLGETIDKVGANLPEILENKKKEIKIGGLIAGAIERMTQKDLDWMNDLLAKQCEVVKGENESPKLASIFDAHFMGRIRHWFNWAKWAATEQFADFFEDESAGSGPPA